MDCLPQRSEEALRRQAQTTRKGRTKPANLREQVDRKAVEIYKEESKKQWPTPTTQEIEHPDMELTKTGRRKSKSSSSSHSLNLADSVHLWPTARVSDVEGGRIKTEMTDKGFRSKREKSDQWFGAKLRDAVETHEEQVTKKLNADWVEQLMGLPPQWTQLPTEWID